MSSEIVVEQNGPILTVALNRPEVHNALTPTMIGALTAVFQTISSRDAVRVVVLTGNGRSFCAGADLAFMRAAADYTFVENVRDGEAIFDLMLMIEQCPKPVVARVNGAAIGGGVGLISCCDIVLAVDRAKFGFSEARLGIVPAVISPFVLARIGAVNARELFLTGERFGAQQAQRIGLVNHVVAEVDLDTAVAERVAQLLQAAPGAQSAAKDLIRHVTHKPKEAMRDYTAELIARLRAAEEGREGMSAFLQKRQPYWREETK